MVRRKVAIVVQRYGADINGGAELHARLLAAALLPYYNIDVLTSRAFDYRTWGAHYPLGETWLDGCRVLRFDHPCRDKSAGKMMPRRHRLRFKRRRWVSRLGWPPVPAVSGDRRLDGEAYLEAQGPTMSGLLEFLEKNSDSYAAIIFFSIEYHPAAMGVLVASRRAVLVPTLHDIKFMYLPHFHRSFRAPRWIMYNTVAEEALAHRLFGPDIAPGEVVGVGVGKPPTMRWREENQAPDSVVESDDDGSNIRRRFSLEKKGYLIYVGRVDPSKGCVELFEMFSEMISGGSRDLKLVVCGQLFMEKPLDENIILTGFVSDEDRDFLISGAMALVVPSRYESLSLVLLESLAAGCPVIVNGDCEVLVQHVEASDAGCVYKNSSEFQKAVQMLATQSEQDLAAMASAGRAYVEARYSWDRIIERYRAVIDNVDEQAAALVELMPEIGM